MALPEQLTLTAPSMSKQPLSTYRVQLHAGFPLASLRAQLDYLTGIGVDWVYASPVFAAVPGSTHGYDVISYELNPEICTPEEWASFHEERKRLGLGWLQDIVPNHMAFDVANPWVRELLRHGEASTVAKHFDIDWRHPMHRGQVMLPILGEPLADCIAAGHVRLDREARVLHVYDRELPLSTRSLGKLASRPDLPLPEVLAAQHYALAYWKDTHAEINYRRFFTVNGLIGLRQERPETFRATHALVLEWMRDGLIDGLRLDHIDGLTDPTGYLRKLREAAGEDAYIVCEKILEGHEELPDAWPVQGTTGYDFLASAQALLRDPERERDLVDVYASYVGDVGAPDRDTHLARLVYDNKHWILHERMAGELTNVAHHAQGALAGLPLGLDVARLRRTIGAWLCGFPRYRVYPRRGRLPAEQRKLMVHAVDRALAIDNAEAEGLQMLRSWLRSITSVDGKTQDFLQSAMQLAGPLMAKGIEDTTFYQDFGLLAHNEVGADPSPSAALRVEEYHDRMLRRRLTDMNATATHDTKRGEDARVRLLALPHAAEAWRAFAKTAFAVLDELDSSLDRNHAYFLIQSLYSGAASAAELRENGFAERLKALSTKALREGKRLSNWSEPDVVVEAAAHAGIVLLLRSEDLADALDVLLDLTAPLTWRITVALHVLKLTAPGAPDVYQGTEFLDYSFVDPDNRRPVDYAARRAALDTAPALDLAECTLPADEAKVALLRRLLRARKSERALWQKGAYVPVRVEGRDRERFICYRRVFGDDSALVLIDLRPARAIVDIRVQLPAMGQQREVLTGRTRELGGAHEGAELLGGVSAAVYVPAR